MGRCILVPSNQKQIKSLLITSDAVSDLVTITVVNINEATTKWRIYFSFCFPGGCVFVLCGLLQELGKSISFYHSLTQFPLTTTALL